MKFVHLLMFVAMLCGVVSCSDANSDLIPKQDVAKLKNSARGYRFPRGVVKSKTYEPFWIQHISTGFKRRQENETPAELGSLADMTGCQFTKPSEDEIFASVYTDTSWSKTKVYTYSKEDIADSTENFIKSYRVRGKDPSVKGVMPKKHMLVVDVFVTETEKPVYLALLADSEVIWNINKSEYSKISRVALIGKHTLGIANLDEAVPVEVLAGKKLKRCEVSPTREPKKHWGYFKYSDDSAYGRRDFKKKKARHLEFANWFYDNFGVRTDTNIAQAHRVEHFLIGDIPGKPSSRISFKTLAGTKVRLSKNDNALISGYRDFKKLYAHQVMAFAEKMAGGDLASLAPQK